VGELVFGAGAYGVQVLKFGLSWDVVASLRPSRFP